MHAGKLPVHLASFVVWKDVLRLNVQQGNAPALGVKEKLKRKVQRHGSEWLQCYAMIGLPTIGFFLFSLYPIIWVLIMAFYDYDGIVSNFVGLDNFITIFTKDAMYWNSVIETLIIGFGKLLVEIPLAFFFAVVLNSNLKGRSIFRVSYFMPSVMSASVMALIFYFLFASYNGVVNNALQALHMIQAPINWFGSRWTATAVIMIVSLWMGVGINMIYFLAGLQSVPQELYECSELDGCNKFQQFYHITLPTLKPITQTIILFAIIGTMKISDLVLVLTNGGPAGQTDVMMTYVYKYFFVQGDVSTAKYGYASALGFVSALIIAAISLGYLFYSKKKNED